MAADPLDTVDLRLKTLGRQVVGFNGRASSSAGAAAVMSPVRISTRRFWARPSGCHCHPGWCSAPLGGTRRTRRRRKRIRCRAALAMPPAPMPHAPPTALVGRVVTDGVGMALDRDRARGGLDLFVSTSSSADCAAGVRSDLANSKSTSLGSFDLHRRLRDAPGFGALARAHQQSDIGLGAAGPGEHRVILQCGRALRLNRHLDRTAGRRSRTTAWWSPAAAQ